MENDVRITVRVSAEVVERLDRLAAVRGEKRSDCVRFLISEGLLGGIEKEYASPMTQLVRREVESLEERLAERLAAIEDSIDEIGGDSKTAGEEARRMLGALLWFSSFDEHRDEGGQMDAWLRLAMFESEAVLSGERLKDFDPVDGGC